jgi:cbb3-type cytochrome oxidase subunit 1
MSKWFLRLAVVYFVFGVVLGNIMGASMEFTLTPVHAHANLLGWVSLAVIGLIYHAMPHAANTKLAKVHFWLHNVGLPIQMGALALFVTGTKAAGPILGMASVVIGLGVVCFAINVWNHTKA